MRRHRWLLGGVVFASACGGGSCPGISQEEPPPPRLSAKPGTGPGTESPAALIGGFLYPGVGSLAGSFEIDVPIFTNPRRTAYFALEANFRVDGLRTLALRWTRTGAAPIEVPLIDGPCSSSDPATIDLQLRFSANTARAHAGRAANVAFTREMETRIDNGEALAYITCTASQSGEVIANGGVDFNVAVLLPSSVLGSGGELGVMAVNVADGVRSQATTMAIVKTETTIAAVGDSVIWGQGVTPGSKAIDLLAARVVSAVGPIRPVTMMAHSAAIINRGADGDRIADLGATLEIAATRGCPATPGVSGEIPRRQPTLQCQIFTMSRLACTVDTAQLGVAAVPRITCAPDTPPAGGTPLALAVFDTGVRWDVVLLGGCINDISPGDIVLGVPGLVTTGEVRAAARRECDLTKGLADLATFLPNAVIPITGYHLIIDNRSNPVSTGCVPPPQAMGFVPGVAMIVALATARAPMAARSAAFQSASDAALSESVGRLDAADGAGTVLFVPISSSFGPGTAFLSPGSLLFPLSCGLGLAPFAATDPVVASRAVACAAFHNASGGPPPPEQQVCDRASAFHPNTAGHAAIDALVGAALTARGLLVPAG